MIKTAKVCVLCGRTHKVGKEYQYLTSYDDTGMRYLAPVVQVEPVCLRCMLSQAWFTCIRIGRTARTERQCRVEEQVDNLRYTLWAMDSLDKPWWRFPKTIFTDMNSSETLLWIIQRNFGIDLVAARDAVISKNRKRGYYGND